MTWLVVLEKKPGGGGGGGRGGVFEQFFWGLGLILHWFWFRFVLFWWIGFVAGLVLVGFGSVGAGCSFLGLIDV